MFTLQEIIEIVVSIVLVSIIFSNMLKSKLLQNEKERFKLSVFLTIPSIIFHELGHKFVALFFGNYAVYHVALNWLLLGLVLSYLGLPIFFVPAYVSIHYVNYSKLAFVLTALAGPLVNLVIFVFSKYMFSRKPSLYFAILMDINKWLFIFNILPIIPGTDGYQALFALFS